jgi:hypothetical protein
MVAEAVTPDGKLGDLHRWIQALLFDPSQIGDDEKRSHGAVIWVEAHALCSPERVGAKHGIVADLQPVEAGLAIALAGDDTGEPQERPKVDRGRLDVLARARCAGFMMAE